jgi:hypothetical protein
MPGFAEIDEELWNMAILSIDRSMLTVPTSEQKRFGPTSILVCKVLQIHQMKQIGRDRNKLGN